MSRNLWMLSFLKVFQLLFGSRSIFCFILAPCTIRRSETNMCIGIRLKVSFPGNEPSRIKAMHSWAISIGACHGYRLWKKNWGLLLRTSCRKNWKQYSTLLLIGGACLAWGTPPKEVMLRHVHQMVLERSIRWLISLRGSPRGPFFLAAWSMVSGDIEVDTDMFPDVQWRSTCHTTFTSPILACISHALSHASLAQKACLQHSSSACHRFVEYCWKFDSADVTCWC